MEKVHRWHLYDLDACSRDWDTFFKLLNDSHPINIFTMEQSASEVVLYDTTVVKSSSSLKLKLYTKPTDLSYQELDSHNQSKFKQEGPYSQLIWVIRNCSDDSDFKKESSVIPNHFKRRVYPTTLLTKAWNQAKNLPRSEIPSPRTRTCNDRIPLLLTTTT